MSTTSAADALFPATHPWGAHVAMAATAGEHAEWTPAYGPLPALYLGHGSPFLLEDSEWMSQLHAWARALPRPKAILIVSAHWEHAPTAISASAPAELVYDFGGFAAHYYTMRYDTPDASALATSVAALMPDNEPLHQHRTRGLDHGAWIPLKIMYPEADIPVLQMSMPTHDPERLMDLGRRIKSLREEGVLVIGSGFMTHGLPYMDWNDLSKVPGWSRDFDLWAAETLARGAVDELSDYGRLAPGMPYAHPTVEHFTPLFITLGAAEDPGLAPMTTIEGFATGLSKRSIQVA
jgi:4,5-DOPA dioxygenase extradiol